MYKIIQLKGKSQMDRRISIIINANKIKTKKIENTRQKQEIHD